MRQGDVSCARPFELELLSATRRTSGPAASISAVTRWRSPTTSRQRSCMPSRQSSRFSVAKRGGSGSAPPPDSEAKTSAIEPVLGLSWGAATENERRTRRAGTVMARAGGGAKGWGERKKARPEQPSYGPTSCSSWSWQAAICSGRRRSGLSCRRPNANLTAAAAGASKQRRARTADDRRPFDDSSPAASGADVAVGARQLLSDDNDGDKASSLQRRFVAPRLPCSHQGRRPRARARLQHDGTLIHERPARKVQDEIPPSHSLLTRRCRCRRPWPRP